MEILKTIFETEYMDKEPSTPEFESLLQRDFSLWEETEKTMGAQFAENHWFQRLELEQSRRFFDFCQGFHLGFTLALEGLRPEKKDSLC